MLFYHDYYYDLCNVSRWLLAVEVKKERQWERNDKLTAVNGKVVTRLMKEGVGLSRAETLQQRAERERK